MQVTETQIDELTRQFHVAVPAADIERKVETRLLELAQTVKLPGFRPGKVPLGLLRKRFGASVISEVVEQAINESSQVVIGERNMRVAMQPRVELASVPEQGDLEYTLSVELLPEITPPDYGQISLERLVAHIDEAEIERRLGRFADAVGEESAVEEPRPVAVDDIVVLDIHGPEDRWPFDNAESLGVRIRIGLEGPIPGFGEQLVGLMPGTRTDVTVTVPADAARADLAGQSRTWDVELKEIRVRTPAPLDDELAKRGGWESLDGLRTWLREQHETELKSLARLRLKRALLDRLAELYTFAVPKGLLDREYEALVRQMRQAEPGETPPEAEAHVHDETCGHDQAPENEHADDQGAAHAEEGHVHDENCGHGHEHAEAEPKSALDADLPEDKRHEYRELALRRVRLGLILAEIGRVNNLRVAQEELAKAMISHARRFPGQEQAVLEFLRKTPDAQESLAAPILEEKVVDFILEMANVTERPVDMAELLRDPDAGTTS